MVSADPKSRSNSLRAVREGASNEGSQYRRHSECEAEKRSKNGSLAQWNEGNNDHDRTALNACRSYASDCATNDDYDEGQDAEDLMALCITYEHRK
jgi:hypothetical protein